MRFGSKIFSQLRKMAAISPFSSEKLHIFHGANLEGNPVDMFRAHIAFHLAPIASVDPDVIVPALEWTQTADRGDLVLAVPRLRIKGEKPDILANKWAIELAEQDTSSVLTKVIAKGPFLQFFFNPTILAKLVIPAVLKPKEGTSFGDSDVGKGKRVVVEFSSPNIAKPFHAGHLRSTIIGGFIASLHERMGYDVIRINYLGDWGKQFGLLAVGFKRFGSESELETDPINHLFKVYVTVSAAQAAEEKVFTEVTAQAALPEDSDEATRKQAADTVKEAVIAARAALTALNKNEPFSSETKFGDDIAADSAFFAKRPIDTEAKEYFRKMEDGDKDALEIWSRFRNFSIEKYKSTYGRLNINYDVYSGESQVSNESMQSVIELFEKKGLIHVDRGAKLIDFSRFNKKLGKALMQKSDGTSLYLTRDVGAAIERYEKYKFDKMIYVVASQQDLHLAQLFKILELCDFPWAKTLQHINFGMVQGMSTRKGTVVFLDTILDDTKNAMHEVMKKNTAKYELVEDPEMVANLVGISAVMIQDMQSKRVNNYKFDWSRMLSFEGDTGPYLQYAHSRLCSVERRALGDSELNLSTVDLTDVDFSKLEEPAAQELIRELAKYPDVLLNALRTLEPSTVVSYLFKLTHIVSSCYTVLWVAGQPAELAAPRLALYSAARNVLRSGMILLGLTPVERM
ncbi:hypothetical protein V1511DRAFT_497200 [Dipodascopsis uninucleata]